MLQSFKATTRPSDGPPRLAALRREMAREGLAGFLVPRSDAHQGEWVPPRDERLAWLTGFTGSAGFCAALLDIAGVFIDGRYRLQVRAQVDTDHFTPVDWPETRLADWLRTQLPKGGIIGFDPWLHVKREIDELEQALEGSNITLQRVDNLVDRIWADQPPPPAGRIIVHELEYAGEPSAEKRRRLGDSLRQAGHQACVLSKPDSINWLLNIRGDDIDRMPVVLGFAILHANGCVDLFVDPAKADDRVRAHLGDDVSILPPQGFAAALTALDGPVRLDPATAPVWVGDQLEKGGVEIAWEGDPCTLPKARKNPVEIAGARAAHLRDAVPIARLLAWLETPPEGLDEIAVVTRLEQLRRETGQLVDISFETICGAGPNGAIVHYRVTEETNRPLRRGELLLIDSGGQYRDGTTDITRTIAMGPPAPDAQRAFTLVLKGMIAVSLARWPKGLAGRDLDALARAALWQEGMDYDHGTGHGVGSFLGVHEGPQGLSRRATTPLEPGMILSNEPGYYREGAFGIRIENLVVVRKAAPGADDWREMLEFETLTFAPIDRRLILPELLGEAERAWLNRYHAQVLEKTAPNCPPDVAEWLERACAPI